MSQVLLYVTVSNSEEGVRIGRTLVDERLAACANVLPGSTAVYRWEGEIKTEREAVLIVKTRAALAEAATDRVKALHSYSLPCVLVLAVDGGNAEFLAWIDHETAVSR